MAHGASRSEPGTACFHRRNRRLNQNDATLWPLPARRTARFLRSVRPLENNDLRGRVAQRSNHRALRVRRTNERRKIPRLGGAIPRSDIAGRRHCRHGQSVEPQGSRCPRRHRKSWGQPALSAALQPDLNPIEQVFAKLKSLLRKAAARTLEDLIGAIANALTKFDPAECANYLNHSGYRHRP